MEGIAEEGGEGGRNGGKEDGEGWSKSRQPIYTNILGYIYAIPVLFSMIGT